MKEFIINVVSDDIDYNLFSFSLSIIFQHETTESMLDKLQTFTQSKQIKRNFNRYNKNIEI